MDSEDGELFIKQLATFVRTHEKALANALQLRRQNPPRHGASQSVSSVPTAGLTTPTTVPERPSTATASSSNGLAAALSFGSLNFTSQTAKSAKLALTPHHLFYLLSRFEELKIPVGPMKVRLENLHDTSTSANYVSFLGQSQRTKTRGSDVGSIRSVSSIRSVMSGMSALWSNFGIGSSMSAARTERQKAALDADLKYLYSAFTKVPCLRLAPDFRARLIKGYEEFPFDSAVPLHIFKNCQALEVSDIDFRQFFGWDRMADQLRSLTVKRASLADPADILIDIVLDDMDKRRRRTSKSHSSPTTTRPGTASPRRSMTLATPADLKKSTSAPGSPGTRPTDLNVGSMGSETAVDHEHELALRNSALPASKWRFLRHLSLAENGLVSIPEASLAPLANTLYSLDLSSNEFNEIPDSLASLTALRALNLSKCTIESLHSLTRNPLPAITALNLRDNRLQSLAGVERLYPLERLDLRDNRLKDPVELARLTRIPDIREIWVEGNPFTRTHKDYRITIFNLFRQSPGYTEDVLIDMTGPTYSERKHLVERTQEPAPVPVIKPPVPEPKAVDVSKPAIVYENPKEPAVLRKERPAPKVTASEVNTNSTRSRRRAPKRRIVDLADSQAHVARQPDENESMGAMTGLDNNYRISQTTEVHQNNPAVLEESRTQASRGVPRIDTSVIPKLPPVTPTQEIGTPTSWTDSQKWDVGGEMYRRKIEALRTQVGDGYLNVLSEEHWDVNGTPHFPGSRFGHPDSPLHPSSAVHRPTLQPIHSGRTLG
ncbi:hypothetical protein INS49_005999 [Diaporthe citri]|uniref:uncharacterized protein n=1 Tax=Diaporthe citri TaxID=83186 RepID=UPI001C807EDD|nr:uncharacterized protein INS49_005999 [Diaporthe citri]KAG6364398.1 hypothetical protein INS49_005999 [Diaporthe citri]